MPQPAVPRRALRALTAASALALALLPLAALPASAAPGYDYGDAPADVDAGVGDPARSLVTGPRLGRTVSADRLDPDTGTSTKASESATGDDDDALAAVPPVSVGRLTTLRLDVAVSGVTAPARLCGWVDLDLDRTFAASERTCVDVPVGAGAAVLRWDGRAGVAGDSFVRLRIATVAAEAGLPDGRAASGEVEDFPVAFLDVPPSPQPRLTLETVPAPAVVDRAGQEVRYTYRLRNQGPTALRDVRLADPRVAPDALACSPALGATLTPGARLTCTATVTTTQDDLDFGGLETAAEARAEIADGDPDDPADDVLAVGPASVGIRARPRLQVAVATAPARPAAGDSVTVTATLTNPGNLTLTDLRLERLRPALEGLACPDAPSDGLAPGAALVCTGRSVVTTADARQGQLDVRVGARAEQPYGLPGRGQDDVVATASARVPLTRAAPPPAPTSTPTPDPSAAPSSAAPSPGRPSSAPGPGGAADGGLADSGGPASAVGPAGLLAVAAGAVLLVRSSRRRR